MEGNPSPAEVTGKTWTGWLSEGCDLDSWGQPVEAVAIYSKLKRRIDECLAQENGKTTTTTTTTSSHSIPAIDERRERILSKISLCLGLRCQMLAQSDGPEMASTMTSFEGAAVSLQQMRCLGPWILASLDAGDDDDGQTGSSNSNNILSETSNLLSGEFPVDVDAYQRRKRILETKTKLFDDRRNCDSSVDEKNGNAIANSTADLDDDLARGRIGSLLPAPVMERGKTYVSLKIDKIGLSDGEDFIDPYLTISVKNVSGNDVTMPQSTPVAARKSPDFVHFDRIAIYVQKPLEYLPVGFAIFIQFHHYKPKKKKTSLKCFSFLEKDELKDGQKLVLELYRKPMDAKRKKLKLLTQKERYLHLETFLRTD